MTEISDELRSKLIKAFGLDLDRNLPKPIQDASSGNALSKKPKKAGRLPKRKLRQLEGWEDGQPKGVVRESTTTRKGINLRIYRVVPLLAVVVDGEE